MTPNPVRREPGSTPRMRTFTAGRATGMPGRAAPEGARVAAGLPTPVRAVPAAMVAGSNARQDFVRYLDIRINVPYVVQVFQRFQQMHRQFRRLARQRRRYRGTLG